MKQMLKRAARPELVAVKPAFGAVERLDDGGVHVTVGDTVLRLCAAEYWTLMEMLSDAARRLANVSPRACAPALAPVSEPG